jgi:hypothetical protein
MSPKSADAPVITSCTPRPQDAGSTCAGLGCTTRHRLPDHLDRPGYIQENFDVSALPKSATRKIREGITMNVRFNAVCGDGHASLHSLSHAIHPGVRPTCNGTEWPGLNDQEREQQHG